MTLRRSTTHNDRSVKIALWNAPFVIYLAKKNHKNHKTTLLKKYLLIIIFQIILSVIKQKGEGYRSMVEHLIMLRWVIGSIPHSGFIDPFLIKTCAPRLV